MAFEQRLLTNGCCCCVQEAQISVSIFAPSLTLAPSLQAWHTASGMPLTHEKSRFASQSLDATLDAMGLDLTHVEDEQQATARMAQPQVPVVSAEALQSIAASARALSDSDQFEAKNNAARVLRQMAGQEHLRRPVADAALLALVGLLKEVDNQEGRRLAAQVIFSLTQTRGISKRLLMTDEALKELHSLLKDTANTTGRLYAAWTLEKLTNISHSIKFRPETCQRVANECSSALISLLQDTTYPDGRTHAAAALSDMAVRQLCGRW
ncbi:hypothetical protein WJX73_009479 [Symbiochloris irregularis]|uniref:Uncharacterized protein n=1 Tax=Symbiochloris irregularis TaxID=706552 RepID=A0AAW1PGY7_9CHLO